MKEILNAAILGEELKTEQKDEEDKICECEARVRAYMQMLRVGEGTEGEAGYTKLFKGKNFTNSPHNKDMSTHPQIKVYWYTNSEGKKIYSSAAGAYQVMGYTWNDANMVIQRKVYDIKDFKPESQDLFCIVLFKHKRQGMLKMIIEGKVEEATKKYGSYEWASLPPGRYGQPNKTMKEALALYDDFLKKELAEDTDLHIKKGFLKRFGMSCKCGSKAKKVREGYDIDKAVEYIIKSANSKSISRCARYVRLAIEAGGINTNDRPSTTEHAKGYKSYLPNKGFNIIDSNDYSPIKGDIAVFEAFQGEIKYHESGHIQMYTGEMWVSDFIQPDFWAGSDYRKEKPNFTILRWE